MDVLEYKGFRIIKGRKDFGIYQGKQRFFMDYKVRCFEECKTVIDHHKD